MEEVIIIMEEGDEWTRRAMEEPELAERILFFEQISWERENAAAPPPPKTTGAGRKNRR